MRKDRVGPLTHKQRDVLEFLKGFIAERGYPPTRQEIAQHFGYRSCNAAESHLSCLKIKGFIELYPAVGRGIKILNHHIEQTRAVVVPEGWQLVPKDPTEEMVIRGFESEPSPFSSPADWDAYKAMTGCQQAAYRAKLCWIAMLEAASKPEREA